MYLFSKMFRLALGRTQSRVQWVTRECFPWGGFLKQIDIKVIFILEQVMNDQRGGKVWLSFFNRSSEGGWSMLHQWPFDPRERDLAPIVQEVNGPQGWSGWVQQILPPPDRPACTDCAIPAPIYKADTVKYLISG
jgi:hypothetical protein